MVDRNARTFMDHTHYHTTTLGGKAQFAVSVLERCKVWALEAYGASST